MLLRFRMFEIILGPFYLAWRYGFFGMRVIAVPVWKKYTTSWWVFRLWGRGLLLGCLSFHCVSCVAVLVKIAKRNNSDISWQAFRASSKLLLLQTVTQAFRVWTQLIPAEIKCQCHRQIRRGEMRMEPAAMCFSVVVRKDDSQTVHSVTQLTAEVGDCLGPRNIHLKTWQERVSYHQGITNSSCCKWKWGF